MKKLVSYDVPARAWVAALIAVIRREFARGDSAPDTNVRPREARIFSGTPVFRP